MGGVGGEEPSRGWGCFVAAKGELVGLPFTSAQNKAASCLKLEFSQPRGRPKSPAPVPSVPRPWSPRLFSPRTQASGPRHLCLWAGLLSQPRRPWCAGWGGRPRPPEALGAGSPRGPRPPSRAPCCPPATRHLHNAWRSPGRSNAFIFGVTGGGVREPGPGWG